MNADHEIVVVTGAAGRVGRAVVPLLRRERRVLRLLDIAVPDPRDRDHRDEWIEASITDREALASAFAGATAVIHLGGHAAERTWADILSVNIDGSQAVLDSARVAGVRRVLLASTYHVVGFETPDRLGAAGMIPPRPDTYYAVSKAAMEALGSVFADRFGMTIVSARIGSFGRRPAGPRGLAQWCSPGDAARLMEAVIAREEPGHTIVWAVSDNSPGWFPLDAGRSIGFEPRDDAARELVAMHRAGRTVEIPERIDDLDLDSILGYGFVTPALPLGHPLLD
ncbi:NAD-dependent dehydratase [Agromyces sp. Root81]|uniref:NAD-dependent epimerase/dehydratase family protein n=1 Tax=Agromyces sp. Root81 TaxID=1736601 RepID=UPI0006F87753|nr:NAD(P)-dependent oxidoreductase [Agromyces sp. Root81]KRC59217.1 NAD-dependent dehydratase [Agromyces sp. Root81]